MLNGLVHSLERGCMHPGWRLTSLWLLGALGEVFSYSITLEDVMKPEVTFHAIVSVREGRQRVRRACLKRGTTVSALLEVI